ncbi:hypothetical protein [Phytohabitans rumicis]|uniref:Ribosomal protein L7/L12 C-terminal domain-containing protein n=1 Tax=Phytohabitans rumicis TaxID=1076125 RepID=A0A6V8KNT5_9ACTN|nr:hypothetical protein [Phytohabitans rumicis]GFJ86823.1 hypothetical protein Prum_004650 [Phytohabitans rumicis]
MAKATRILAGVAVAALAAAGVAAVVRYRQGQQPAPDERDHLDELDVRLQAADASRVIANLQRNQGISVTRLRRWIAGLRRGTLSPEEATVAESDFDALEREADQGQI